MPRFLKWLLSLFVTTVTTQDDVDGDRPDCPHWRDEVLKVQLQIDALKYEGARRLLKRLDD